MLSTSRKAALRQSWWREAQEPGSTGAQRAVMGHLGQEADRQGTWHIESGQGMETGQPPRPLFSPSPASSLSFLSSCFYQMLVCLPEDWELRPHGRAATTPFLPSVWTKGTAGSQGAGRALVAVPPAGLASEVSGLSAFGLPGSNEPSSCRALCPGTLAEFHPSHFIFCLTGTC